MAEKLLDGVSYESPDGDILPYADIEEPTGITTSTEIEVLERSEGYIQAENIIKAGIEKSRGYASVKVEYWVAQEDSSNGGYENRTTLGHFLGSNFLHDMMPNDEYVELVAKYSAVAKNEQPSEVVEAFDAPEGSQMQARKVGNAATERVVPAYHSGVHEYRDVQSARAGDRLDDN